MTDTFLYLNSTADLPHTLQTSPDVSPTDRELLMLIHNLSHTDGFCSAGNPFFAKKLGKSEKTIANSLTTLRHLTYIEVIGGGNQWTPRQIVVKTDILIQQEQETQAFFEQKTLELNQYAEARNKTAEARREYTERYRNTMSPDFAPESDAGNAPGTHREGTLNRINTQETDQQKQNNNNHNHTTTTDQPSSSSLSGDQSMASHSHHDTPSDTESVTPDPLHHDELLALAGTFPELNISANDIEKAMRTNALSLDQVRHIYLNTAAAHTSHTILKTPKSYFFGCCNKAMNGAYDFEIAHESGQHHASAHIAAVPVTPVDPNEPEQVWDAAKTILETTLTRGSFNTWIRQMTLDAITPERALFTVPDEIFVYQLTQHYIPVLQRTFQQLGAPVTTIEFCCVDTATHSQT